MQKVTFKGAPVALRGSLPKIGKKARDFRLTNAKLDDVGLSAFSGKVKLLNCVPSLDTSVCALSAKRFEKEAAKLPGLAILTISRDLPFAQERFCKTEGMTNVTFLSVLRDKGFAKAYGLDMADGPLAGLLARAVIVVDKDDTVRYVQLVPEIGQEPDYDAALKAVRPLLA
jgi:thiol peroxidase